MICSNKLKFILFGLLFIGFKIDAQEMLESTSIANNITRDVITSSRTTTSTTSATTSVNYMAQINTYITRNNNFPISGTIKILNNSNSVSIQTTNKININEDILKRIKTYLERIVSPKTVNISLAQNKNNIIMIQIKFN